MSLDTARRVLRIEATALSELLERLDASFERAVDLLLACKGRVVIIGMGKSGLIGRKIAATFSSTGTPSVFLHPAEAVHGDLGMLMRDDVVMAVSYGGETEEIIALLETIKRLGLRMIALTGHPKSTIAAASDVVLDVSVKEEACSLNLAPTASTTDTLSLQSCKWSCHPHRRSLRHPSWSLPNPQSGSPYLCRSRCWERLQDRLCPQEVQHWQCWQQFQRSPSHWRPP